jgi:uncharacterized protein (TIGR00369 family)
VTISDPQRFASRFVAAVRHCELLGIEVVKASQQGATLALPYAESIVGDPTTGVIHSGALTTLMDTALGVAVPLALQKFELCPTLDLRIDYMGAAEPGRTVLGEAQIYRITDNVIFARGTAFQGDASRPIAYCVATFMRLGRNFEQAGDTR